MNQQESELVLNADGSVYHLKLKAENIADNVLLVGDPGRVELVSEYFDEVTFEQQNREFCTRTGSVNGVGVTVLSTGIGTDNIDIVATELDAAVNIDPVTRKPFEQQRQLNLIRLGTCGALQSDLEVDSIVVSEASLGLDGVAHFYDMSISEREARTASEFMAHCQWPEQWNRAYARWASPELVEHFSHLGTRGITMTSNGFFGPQGRAIRIPLAKMDMNDAFRSYEGEGLRVCNYEMECSALYALGGALGHRCLTMCVIVTNRYAGKFSKDYQPAIHRMVKGTIAGLQSLA